MHAAPSAGLSEAVIFDLDGTLVDSRLALESTRRGVAELLAEARGPEQRASSPEIPQRPLSELLREAQALGSPWAERALALVDAMEASAVPRLMAGARPTLRWLRARRTVGMAVLTNSGRDGVTRLLERLGVADLFDLVLCREDVPMLKPSPLGLRLAVARLGHPGRAIYVGDSWIDAQAAQEAPLPFIAFRLAPQTLAQRGLPSPWASAEDWAALRRVLGAWLTQSGAAHGSRLPPGS